MAVATPFSCWWGVSWGLVREEGEGGGGKGEGGRGKGKREGGRGRKEVPCGSAPPRLWPSRPCAHYALPPIALSRRR